MALVIYQQPELYHPIHIPVMLEVGSDNTANANFKYKVTIVLPADPNRILYISPRPTDARLELDLATHLRDYMEYDNFILPTGFNFTSAPYVDYSITVEENWEGDDQGIDIATGNKTATNVLLDRQEWLSFDFEKYMIKESGIAPITGELLINKPLGVPMYRDEYYHIHVVGMTDNDFMRAKVSQYDAQGVPIAAPDFIFNAGVSTQNARAVFFKLDLSLSAFDVLCKRIGITIQDGNTDDVTVEKFFDLETYDCTPWERWKLVYMDRGGSYNNVSLDMISSSSMEVKPKTYRKRIDPLNDSPRKRGVTRYTQRSSEKFMLNTDYLTEVQALTLEDLIESPNVYRDMRNIDGWGATDFLPVEVLTKTLERYSYSKNDMPQYPIEVRYSFEKNVRHE